MLGEGYDLPKTLCASPPCLRPYREPLAFSMQFVGRVLRMAEPSVPGSPGNRAYKLVSHVGLNDERWWEDFRRFDTDDQQFFAEFLAGEEQIIEGDGPRPRLTLRPFIRVLNWKTVTKSTFRRDS